MYSEVQLSIFQSYSVFNVNFPLFVPVVLLSHSGGIVTRSGNLTLYLWKIRDC